MARRLLLHVCCGPCAAHAVLGLKKEYDTKLFFYNPNIWPEEEYQRRLDAAKTLAQSAKLELAVGLYEPATWDRAVAGLENELEGGGRCRVCFKFRLDAAASFAVRNGFECFTTTLASSPHKDARLIHAIGEEAGRRSGCEFLETDFKRGDGFRKSTEASRALGLYRQSYCGCKFSVNTR